MLSNPPNSLHDRHRQHRRQHSTPTAFEPMKISNLPSIQRNNGHRRGMSLDQRRHQKFLQERTVSNINTGFSTTPQHILRETQQQRLIRPGEAYAHFDDNEGYLNSPVITPHRQSFDTDYTNSFRENIQQSPSYDYIGHIHSSLGGLTRHFNGNNDFNLFSPDSVLTPSSYLEFPSSQGSSISSTGHESNSRRSSASRRLSAGLLDGVSQFENLALQSPHRPLTPSNDNVEAYFPPTPIDTPHVNMMRHGLMNARFMDDYDTSMEETIKPIRQQRPRGIFYDMRKKLESNSDSRHLMPDTTSEATSYDSASMPLGNLTNLSTLNLDCLKNENQFSHESSFSQNPTDISPALSGYRSSPDECQIPLFSDPFANGPKLEANSIHYSHITANTITPLSPGQNSTDPRAGSIPTINLEESITETGITVDDIASFISGPDPLDGGKWLCMYPDCKKRFGRKENIKSHVQTHLGDRQFQCPYCKKCFVRQHDLKRHAKIHSGVKPYPCRCGNSFARHDALTRHRQRGMCVGAFEGVVKKVAKRGRPRKPRPDDEERLDKSFRTQKKNKEVSATSSTSGCSESDATSPRSDLGEVTDVFDYFQAPFVHQTSGFQGPQQQSSRTNSYFSSQSIGPQSLDELGISQVSNIGSIAENTNLSSQPISPTKSIYHNNSNHSSPKLCALDPSPALCSKYFCHEQVPANGASIEMDIPEMPNLSTPDNDVFFDTFEAADQISNISGPEHAEDLLMSKFVDPFGQASGNEFWKNPVNAFFRSS